MDVLKTLALRVRSLLGTRTLKHELDDELRFHIEMQTEAHIRAGAPAAEARRRALSQFGGVERMAEECRDARTGSRVHAVLRAMRLGARRLRREPAFVLPATATIAIGVGALTSIFALADAVLLRPLPYPSGERIVELRHTLPGWGIESSGHSGGTFAHYAASSTAFEAMGAWFERELSITESENPERIQAALVTPGVLHVLGVQPVVGRLFNDEDEGGRAVLLSHALWQSRYAGDPQIAGRTVRINGVEREIVGVLPAGTDFPHRGTQMLFGMGAATDATEGELRNLYMEAIGRLRPGVSTVDAEADLVRLIATLPDKYGDVTAAQLAESRIAPRVRTLKESITGDVRPALLLLLCTALFVLLIAVANVANLVLVRAEHQRREVAVERALGASSNTIALRFITEYALLVTLGTALGLGAAYLAIQTRFGFDAWQLPRIHDATLTLRAAALAGAAGTAMTALLAGLAMARTARLDVQAALKGSLQRATSSRESAVAQQSLAALQVALACALLIAAGVMVQSVARLARVPLGFSPANVLAFDAALPVRQYRTYNAQAGFHEALAERLRALPGIEAVGAVSALPLTHQPNWADAAVIAPDMSRPDVPLVAITRSATPDYFAALDVPLLRGRTFTADDVRDHGAGVIVSASLANALFGSVDVIGRRIELPDERTAPLTIIGVTGDIRGATLAEPPARLVYMPAVAGAVVTDGIAPIPVWPGEMTFVVRTALPDATILPSIRSAMAELDATLPLAYPRTLDDLVAASSARSRIAALLLLAGATGALLLGVVGIYGVIAYAVRRRAPELALRMVLGASPQSILTMVLKRGVVVALAGIVGGIAAALALTQLLRSVLYEVSPHDPLTIAGAALGMLIVALVASGVPALRAARTQPSSALADH